MNICLAGILISLFLKNPLTNTRMSVLFTYTCCDLSAIRMGIYQILLIFA